MGGYKISMNNQQPDQTDSNSSQTSQPAPQNVPAVPPPSGAIPPITSVPGLAPAEQTANANFVSTPQTASNMQAPDDASDSDLIEKEWVVKAKDIVQHTQNNPHEQQKAMSKFKADYMKKRHNKDIKTESI